MSVWVVETTVAAAVAVDPCTTVVVPATSVETPTSSSHKTPPNPGIDMHGNDFWCIKTRITLFVCDFPYPSMTSLYFVLSWKTDKILKPQLKIYILHALVSIFWDRVYNLTWVSCYHSSSVQKQTKRTRACSKQVALSSHGSLEHGVPMTWVTDMVGSVGGKRLSSDSEWDGAVFRISTSHRTPLCPRFHGP